MPQLFAIFLNVLAPVFLLVLLGYWSAPRLRLDAQTLSRVAYYVLTPAFVLTVLGSAQIEPSLALRMIVFISAVYLGSALIALGFARALRRSAAMTAAYVMLAVFGNVGNFGLPIVQFAQGQSALTPATLYFLSNNALGFAVCVIAANLQRGTHWQATLRVLKTPGLVALVPALALNALNVQLPLVVSRPLELLSGAMIPVMLIVLGAQLASAGIPRLSGDMLLAACIRLVGGAALGFALAALSGLGGLERSAGILEASMPCAVLVSIIALENDVLPEFVTATVLLSNLVSILTLAVVLALL